MVSSPPSTLGVITRPVSIVFLSLPFPPVDRRLVADVHLAKGTGLPSAASMATTLRNSLFFKSFRPRDSRSSSVSAALSSLGNPVADAVEEGGEVLEVFLAPLVERVLVALGALQPHAQKGVAEAQGLLVRACACCCATSSAASSRAGRNRAGSACAGTTTYRWCTARSSRRQLAGRQHQPFDQLVVGHVLVDSLVDPPIPLLVIRRAELLLGHATFVVARHVAELRGPPGGIGRPAQQLVDLRRSACRRNGPPGRPGFRRAWAACR